MAATNLARTRLDGVDFQEAVLRAKDAEGNIIPRRLWKIQKDIVRAIESPEITSVSVAGCHASGKTDVLSGVVLHFLDKHNQGKVPILAPTQRQVKTFISEIEIKRQISLYNHRFPECSALGLKITGDRYMQGFSSSRSVNIQGPHGRDILIVVDEAPGVQPDLWDAIEGMRSGGNVKVVKLGNPVVPSGEFYKDFTKPRSGLATFNISAFDTPNLIGKTMEDVLRMSEAELDDNPRPYLIRRRWVKEMYEKWGPESGRFLSRVLGRFPHQSSWAVFLRQWIERAQRDATEAEVRAAAGNDIRVGIDVAGGGEDETVGYARVDGIILEMIALSEGDPEIVFQRLAHWLNSLVTTYGGKYPLGAIVFDSVGIGEHLGPRLAALGFDMWAFRAGNMAVDSEGYRNQKAEIYWNARQAFERNEISGLEDQETRDQLVEIMYEDRSGKRVQIESKKDAKKNRAIDSPDRAEALIMSLMQVVPRLQTFEDGYQPSRISRY